MSEDHVQRPSLRPSMRPSLRPTAAVKLLDEPLADEERVLDAFVAGLATGETTADMFERLHQAAQRDDRVANLGFAYERLPRDTRVKTLPKARQVELWLYAAGFFADVFGDDTAAVPYAERALQIAPDSPEAFARLERLLAATQDGLKLAKICSAVAGHQKHVADKLRLLRRAVELLAAFGSAAQESIPLLQQILELEPGDRAAREALEQMYLATRRGRDLAKLLEEALGADPPAAEADELRFRLVGLYRGELRDPPKAAPHVEALLERDPVSEQAIQAAEALLDHRALVGRLAPRLSEVYARLGRTEDEATTLTLELKIARPPRLTEVHRRLVVLRQEVLQDPAGALELLEPLIARDPTDDDLRRRYLDVSATFHRQIEAARLLTRAMQLVKDPATRARIGLEVARLYASEGEPRRAQAALEQILQQAGDDATRLEAARLLIGLNDPGLDVKVLAQALEHVIRLDPELSSRVPAARRLAELCEKEIRDPARAVLAWKTLIHSPRASEALDRLEALSVELDDAEGLVEVLEQRAARATSPEQARELGFRVAELRSTRLGDGGGALEAWRRLVARYGPSRDAHARMIPLLEQARAWEELARVLEQDVALAPEKERPGVLGRLAQVRLKHLDDPAGALAAFREALAVDPADKTSRRAVERLLAHGDQRAAAADVLERLYRKENHAEGLLRVQVARADVASDPIVEIGHLAAAAQLVETALPDAQRGVEIAGRALALAAGVCPDRVPEWLERFERFAGDAGDPATRARLLSRALGDRAVDSPILGTLARATAEAQVAAGETTAAIETYRRALAFEPSSVELLGRIDELLREQGSPEERLALYRAALEQPTEPARRRELMHSIARIQHKDLGDLTAAVATWRRLIGEHPADPSAHAALVDAYESLGDREALVAELERGLEHLKGPRRIETRLKVASVLTQDGEMERALGVYRALIAEADLSNEVLEGIEQLAEAEGETDLLRLAVEKRAQQASEPDDQIRAHERLGEVLVDDPGDRERAVEVWRHAARASRESGSDPERTRRLFERILLQVPDDTDSAEALFGLYAEQGAWVELPKVFSVLLRHDASFGRAVDLLSELVPTLVSAGAGAHALAMTDEALGTQGGEPTRRARDLLLLKARLLVAGDPSDPTEVLALYRMLVETYDRAEDAEAYEQVLTRAGPPAAHREAWRWLLGWRAERSADPTATLLELAQLEEAEGGDLGRALEAYQRILAREPGHRGALSALCRIHAQQGDSGAVLAGLQALRDGAEGDEAIALDVQRAALLAGELDRMPDALPLLRHVLEVAPTHAEALQITRQALEHAATREAAAELLETVAREAVDPDLAAQVLEALLHASAGAGPLREARARWYARLVELREPLPVAALAVAVAGARELPECGDLWDQAERLSRRAEQPEVLAEAYRAALESAVEPSVAEDVGRRMIEFHEEWFDDPASVLRMLERVLTLSPRARWALDRVKLALNAEGRWDDLFTLYDNAIESTTDAAEREDLLDEAAVAAKDLAGDLDRAIHYFERLTVCRPRDTRLEATLERLYERCGRPRELIRLIEGRLPLLQGREAEQQRLRLAALRLDVGDPEAAFQCIVTAHATDPEEPKGYALLERLLAALPVEAPAPKKRRSKKAPPPTLAERCLRLLDAHYRAPQDRARLLRAELRFVQAPRERLARLGTLLGLEEEVQDDAGALETLGEILRLDPKPAGHRARLEALSARTGKRREQVDLLVDVASGLTDRAVQIELYREAAATARQALGDAGLATELYQRVLELSTASPESALAATRELDALLASAGRSADRCAVLETMVSVERDPARRRAVLAEVASIALGTLGDPARAARAWRARLSDDPDDLEALDGLESALEHLGDPAELVSVLERRAAIAPGKAARRDRIRVARLREQKLGDRSGAIEAWRRIRVESEGDEESFDALFRLLEAEARWDELAALVDEAAERAGESAPRVELRRLLGDIHRQHTGDPLRAVAAYVDAGDWDRAKEVAGSIAEGGQAEEVLSELIDLAVRAWSRQAGGPESAAAQAAHWAIQLLVKRLLDEGAAERALQLQVRAAALPFERPQRRQFSRDAAWVACDRLGDAGRALGILRGLFQENAADEVATGAVARFARLLEDAARYDELATVWEEQARVRAATGDRAGAAALWARAATIWEETLGDADRAVAVHRLGAAIGGEASLEALARLQSAGGDLAGAAMTLEWLCAQSSRETLGPRALGLASAYERIGARERAIARLEHAAATVLDGGPVRERLAELYRQEGAWERLAALLVETAGRVADERAQRRALREAARLHLEKRQDPEAAIPLLEQSVELDPDDADVRLALSQALAMAGRFEEAAAFLRAQIERYGSRRPKDRALVHLNLARVCLAAGQRAEALSELDMAAKIDPAQPAVLYELAKLALQESQLTRAEKSYRALLLVLRKSGEGDAGAPSRAEVYLELGEIASRQGDTARAAEFVESAFEAALDGEADARALEEALARQGRYDLLARAVEGRLEVARTPAVAARALADLVLLHAERLGDPPAIAGRVAEQAERIYADLCRDAQPPPEAWGALSDVYEWLGDPAAEARVLERRVAAILQGTLTVQEAEPLYRLAALRLGQAEGVGEGVTLLARALQARPDTDRAETLLLAAAAGPAVDASVIRLLEQVARRAGREPTLVRALALGARAGLVTAEQVREGVALGLAIGEAPQVVQLLRDALGRAESFLPEATAWMHQRLADLLEQAGDLAGAADAKQSAAALVEPDRGRALLLDVARLAREQLADFARAERIYTEMLRREPGDREAWEPLLEVYRRTGDRERLIALIESTVPLVESVRDRSRLRLEQASLLSDDAVGASTAEELLREIIEEDPGFREAAEALTSLYEARGEYIALATLVERQLDLAKTNGDAEAVESMSMKLGGLLERQERLPEAMEVYRNLLDWKESSRAALRAIVRLSEGTGADEEACADALEALLSVEEKDRIGDLAGRLIALRARQGDEPALDRALDRGFAADPGNAALREQIVGRACAAGDHARAARALCRAHEAASASDRALLVRALEAFDKAGVYDEALAMVDGALAQTPGDAALYFERSRLNEGAGRAAEALADLQTAHVKSGDYVRPLIAALERAIAQPGSADVAASTIQLVDLLEGTGQTGQARHHLGQLLKAQPKHRDALRRLAWLASAEGRWEEASAAYRRLIPLEEGDALVSAAMNLADACERSDRLADARGGLERALQVAPGNADLRRRLRELYQATGAHRELAHFLLEEATQEGKVSARAALLLQAADLLLEKNRAPDEAIRVLEEVQSLMPESVEAAVLLGRAHVQLGSHERALAALAQVVESHRGRRVRELAQVHQEMANIHLEAGDLPAALQSLSRAFDLDMRTGELAMQLGYLALDMQDMDIAQRAFRAVTMMRTRQEGTAEGATSEAKAVAYYHLARIAHHQGDVRKARLMASKAVSENPHHEDAQALLGELRNAG
jgi:golgin subfamily B member 1